MGRRGGGAASVSQAASPAYCIYLGVWAMANGGACFCFGVESGERCDVLESPVLLWRAGLSCVAKYFHMIVNKAACIAYVYLGC